MRLAAVASRDKNKARDYAAKHGIPNYYGGYAELLADPLIDCVYISLPASMHAEWSIKALEHGKHVLCEKPVAANAAEASAIADKVAETGLTFAEAFLYRFHPLAFRIEEIIRSGDIGDVLEITTQTGVPLLDKNKVQFDPDLAGGALLDIGCYPANLARWIAGCDEYEVEEASAERTKSGVDGSMSARIKFANGASASINCSLMKFLNSYAYIKGSKGSLFCLAPFSPVVEAGLLTLSIYLLAVKTGSGVKTYRVPARTTYYCQLAAFCDCVRSGAQPVTNALEGVENMRLIDAILTRAGMR